MFPKFIILLKISNFILESLDTRGAEKETEAFDPYLILEKNIRQNKYLFRGFERKTL